MTTRLRHGAALALCLVAIACGDTKRAPEAEPEAPAGEAIEKKAELGPVTVTVRVSPAKPTLVDAITLVLEATAEPGVTVELPPFSEALGRFQITQFVPRQETQSGRSFASQTYTLQAPMSGKQRIPPLRVEFLDERPGQAASDAGAGAVQEILTEEIALDVASVLPDGAIADELRGAREALDASAQGSILGSVWLWLGIGAVAFLGALLAVRRLRDRARLARRASAYDVAMERLGRLERRGLPTPEVVGDWYVELSGIIRRYLEDRYSLRAPELTTEEFLQVARASGVLTTKHRELLTAFLTGCDRVKFARYAPDDEESRQSLQAARSFLEDTRIKVAETAESTGGRA